MWSVKLYYLRYSLDGSEPFEYYTHNGVQKVYKAANADIILCALMRFKTFCGVPLKDCIEQFVIFEMKLCRCLQFGKQGPTITPGVTFPTLCETDVGSFTSPTIQ